MYFTIDGPNGAGKSSTVEKLRQHYLQLGRVVTVARGVGAHHPLGELIHHGDRKYKNPPVVNTLLIAAEKYYTYFAEIQNILDSGGVVISDRHLVTCVAYAYMYREDPGFTWQLYSKLPKPDFNVCLLANESTLHARVIARVTNSYSENHFSRKDERRAFLDALKFVGDRGYAVSCFDTDRVRLNKVASQIIEAVDAVQSKLMRGGRI